MTDILFIFLVLTLGFGGLFGFVSLIDRRSKIQARTGRPSRLIQISALLVGLTGVGLVLWWQFRLPSFVLPLSLVLVGYGVLGRYFDK